MVKLLKSKWIVGERGGWVEGSREYSDEQSGRYVRGRAERRECTALSTATLGLFAGFGFSIPI